MPLFEEPEKKKGIGDTLAWALLGSKGQSGSSSPYGMDYSSLLQTYLRNQMSPSTLAPGIMDETDGGWAGVTEPGVYGQMTQGERDTLGGARRGIGLANIGLASAGLPSPFGPVMGLSLAGILGYDASRFGPGVRGTTALSPADIADLNSRYGIGMWGGRTIGEDPQDESLNFGIDRSLLGGEGNGPGGGAPDGRGGPGGMGDAGGEAMGGAHYAAPGRERVSLYGEAGPEVGIFIPEFMRQPGLQGKEAQVRHALKRALLNLR